MKKVNCFHTESCVSRYKRQSFAVYGVSWLIDVGVAISDIVCEVAESPAKSEPKDKKKK